MENPAAAIADHRADPHEAVPAQKVDEFQPVAVSNSSNL